jgi:hypothetical protein
LDSPATKELAENRQDLEVERVLLVIIIVLLVLLLAGGGFFWAR